MAYFYTEFGDLTEVGSLNAGASYFESRAGGGDEGGPRMELHDIIKAKVKTEFVYGTKANPCQALITSLEKAGMKAVSAMRNWYPSHCVDLPSKKLVLFFGKYAPKENILRPISGGNTYAHSYEARMHLQVSGCGFKIKEPPFTREELFRFFSLLRVPNDQMSTWRKFMSENHYRMIGAGKFASYWCNGWSLKKWSWEYETSYFTKKGICVDQHKPIDGGDGKIPGYAY